LDNLIKSVALTDKLTSTTQMPYFAFNPQQIAEEMGLINFSIYPVGYHYEDKKFEFDWKKLFPIEKIFWLKVLWILMN